MAEYINYIGKLQERFQADGKLPCYKVIKYEGEPHNPVYTVQVNIGKKKVSAEGHSKKEAKVLAAKKMLEMLDAPDSNRNIDRQKTTSNQPKPSTSRTSDQEHTKTTTKRDLKIQIVIEKDV